MDKLSKYLFNEFINVMILIFHQVQQQLNNNILLLLNKYILLMFMN